MAQGRITIRRMTTREIVGRPEGKWFMITMQDDDDGKWGMVIDEPTLERFQAEADQARCRR